MLEVLRTLPGAAEVGVAEIDPEAADTAAFCARYGVGLDVSANCVVVGSGLRRSKLTVPATLLGDLPGAAVVADLAVSAEARRDEPS